MDIIDISSSSEILFSELSFTNYAYLPSHNDIVARDSYDIMLADSEFWICENYGPWETYYLREGDIRLDQDSHLTSINSTISHGDTLDTSTLTIAWYVSVFVEDINGDPVSEAMVWINDTNGENVYTNTTHLNGMINKKVVAHSVMSETGTTYHTPHNITAMEENIKGYVVCEIDTNREITIVLDFDFLGPRPIADAGEDQYAYAGYEVCFDGSNSYDPNGNIVNYTWDFSDGSPLGYGVNPIHCFTNSGWKTVTLTVTDNDGRTDTDTCSIYVLTPPQLIAYAGPNQTVISGEVVKFNGGSHYLGEHWVMQIVDSEGNVGNYNSIAVDSNNIPHISYYNYIPPDPPCGDPLKYARWTGTDWTIEIVDSQGIVGSHTSIAIDKYNRPHISYLDVDDWDLKYVRWTGNVWKTETVDTHYSGEHTSIAIDSNGYPHITYDDDGEGAVKYARKTANGWISEIVCKGSFSSIALDSGNNPYISLVDIGTLKCASWNGSQWNINNVDFLGSAEEGTSIALNCNDNPRISYRGKDNYNLKYAVWDGNQWIIRIVDSTICQGSEPSLALDSCDHPHISYTTGGTLRYAEWTGSSWYFEVLDYGIEYPGRTVSLAIDSNDDSHISYYDDYNLKYAKEMDSIITYDWDFGDGSPHSSEKKTTHVYNTPGVYTVTLTVTDAAGNTDTDTCSITVSRLSVQLNQGMNLISLPTIQPYTHLTRALRPIHGEYDIVQYYDSSDRDDPYKSYTVGKTIGRDLLHINHTMGFWINITQPGGATLLFNGASPSNTSYIPLHSGWNLVGYPSLGNKKRSAALNNLVFGSDVDSVWSFDAATQGWKEIGENDDFEIGKGYWIFAKKKCVWEVPL
jgi:PKD repeat protein